jgi:hypothetical protein
MYKKLKGKYQFKTGRARVATSSKEQGIVKGTTS